MHTGQVIKALRKAHGMTQEELAKQLGVNKSSLQKYENGMVQNLKLNVLKKMCFLFQVPS